MDAVPGVVDENGVSLAAENLQVCACGEFVLLVVSTGMCLFGVSRVCVRSSDGLYRRRPAFLSTLSLVASRPRSLAYLQPKALVQCWVA